MPQTSRVRIALEPLEARENPASLISESFDTVAFPGWAEWTNDGSDAFQRTDGQGVNGTGGLVSTAGSRTGGLMWNTMQVPAGTGAAVTVRLDSLVPAFVFARGSNLGTATPSYVAATVTRGTAINVWEVNAGSVTVLATVQSPPASYFSGNWARVSLVPSGDSCGRTRGNT